MKNEEDYFKIDLNESIQSNIELICEDSQLLKRLAYELKRHESRIRVFNTLNKLCLYSGDGYDKTIEVFDIYKVTFTFSSSFKTFSLTMTFSQSISNERYRFKVIVDFILTCLNATSTQAKLAANEISTYEKHILNALILVNDIINEAKSLHERIRIRYEFLGLKLNDVLHKIR
jgi:hypothetical protein